MPETMPYGGVDPNTLAQFRKLMVDAEGMRSKVYVDPQGYPTVGIGHRVVAADGLKVGQSIDPERIEHFFNQDAGGALGAAQQQAASIGITDPSFIPHLASVNFQLGPGWTKDFKKTWAAMSAGDYATASMEAARSHWMQQTPKRVRAFQAALEALPPRTTDGAE